MFVACPEVRIGMRRGERWTADLEVEKAKRGDVSRNALIVVKKRAMQPGTGRRIVDD